MIDLASWLLRNCGSGPCIETLIGDLTEEYRDGRSAIWFWSQAMVAIPATFIREVGAHKLLTLRAIATGWLLLTGFSWIVRRLSPWIHAALEVYLPRQEPYYATAYRLAVWAPAIDGVKVGNPETLRVDWHQFIAMPFAQIVLSALTSVATGWVVARCHRKHRNPAVFTFVLSFLLYPVASLAWRMVLPGPQLRFWNVLIVESVWWNTWAVMFGVNLTALMLGGLLMRVRTEDRLPLDKPTTLI